MEDRADHTQTEKAGAQDFLAESEKLQSQKMEAIGRLAGGVAHDFNNLLSVIIGYSDLMLGSLGASDPNRTKLEQIIQPVILDVNQIVSKTEKMLRRLVKENIEFGVVLEPNLERVYADPGQIEQVILNLIVNARDAMPNGGKLQVQTSNSRLHSDPGRAGAEGQSGRFVLLEVTDTGTGMDQETQAHIFEPFFTTKEKGKGTGLGLATVYGIVKQSGGFIWVYSEVGKGTSFKIYIPRIDQAEEHIGTSTPSAEVPTGTETVLLTEDEQDVRQIAREFLESGGYKVIEAKDATEAKRLAAEHRGNIDLLVTDMVMPGMTGQELAVHLQSEQPGLCVVFMSGYSERAATEMADADPTVRLLTKPFSRSALLRAVREILHGKPQS